MKASFVIMLVLSLVLGGIAYFYRADCAFDLERYERLAHAALIKPLESADDGLESLKVYFANLAEWISDDNHRGCMLINLMSENGGANIEFSRRENNYRHRLRKALHRALNQASASDEIDGADNDTRATLLTGIVLGLNTAARAGIPGNEFKRLTASIFALIENWRN